MTKMMTLTAFRKTRKEYDVVPYEWKTPGDFARKNPDLARMLAKAESIPAGETSLNNPKAKKVYSYLFRIGLENITCVIEQVGKGDGKKYFWLWTQGKDGVERHLSDAEVWLYDWFCQIGT